MAGLDSETVFPKEIVVHQHSRILQVSFADGQVFDLPFELLRVYSPSAEVQGHGPGQHILQTGKRWVDIVDLQVVGHYAVQPQFSDGHNTGIYSWEYLYRMGQNQQALWDQYAQQLQAAGLDRDADMHPPAAPSCHSH